MRCLAVVSFLLAAIPLFADPLQGNSALPESAVQDGRIRVTGLITDSKGDPMVGVTVSVKDDPATASVTNGFGEYSISVPEKGTVLVFSFLGYVSEEAAVGDRTVINTSMHETAQQLEEVVMTAYGGSIKKESVVGAITSVVPRKLNVSTTRSLSNNLAGAVSGILAVQRSGEPGYDNSTFWIRGISTFQSVGGSPLVLIDGIERDLNTIDLEEIESFSVLKDAAASAVYGVRSANGVILINTKRGKVGKPRVTLKSEFSVTAPVQLPDYIGAAEYLTLMDEIRDKDDHILTPQYEDAIKKTLSGYDPDLYPDVNWIDAITKDVASNQRVTLDVNGGSDALRYSFVAAYYGEQGILERDKRKEYDPSIKLHRYNVRSNVDVKLSSTTQMRFNIGGYMQDRNSTTASVSDLLNRAFKAVPHQFPTQYSSGEIPQNPEGNVWAEATQVGFQRQSSSKIESLFALEQDFRFITPGLKAKVTFSFDRFQTGIVTRSETPQYYNPTKRRTEEGKLDLSTKNANSTNYLGHSSSGNYGEKRRYIEAQISYDRIFGAKHAVSAMLLANRRHFDNGGEVPFRNQGIAGRLSYIFDNRYIAEFNFGYNGSENFAPGKRYGFFPSGAVGWIISEEPFMSSVRKVISNLKIRASYGITGNSELSGRRFAYIATIEDSWNVLNEYRWGLGTTTNRNGMAEGDFGVPNLKWEVVKKANIGFELGLYNGMVDLQVDVFQDKRNNIFMGLNSIPATAGFIRQPWSNNGKVTNQGIEVQLRFSKSFGSDFFLSFMGNFTYAHNEITGRDEAASVIGTNRALTGWPVTQIRGQIAERLFTEADFVGMDASTGIWTLRPEIPEHTFSTVRPGDIMYRDVNKDGFINTFDESAIGGTTDPEMVYGFGANLQWKNLDFGFLFQGTGNMWRMLSRDILPGRNKGEYYNVFTNYENRWTVDNPSQDVFYPRLTYGSSGNNEVASTWWLKKMNFIRLKNIELGYTFPKKWMDKIHLGGIRVFVRGTNVLTFSKFKLWDPELSNATGAAYPAMKTYSGGLEIKF